MATYVDTEKIEDIFSYHKPTESQLEAMAIVRNAAKQFATALVVHVPPSADKSAALRKVREALMTANAGIVLDGRSL